MLGIHDFGAFCKRERAQPQYGTYWNLVGNAVRGFIQQPYALDAFCHSMVRNIVGACVWAACGKLDLRAIGEMLRFGSRSIPQEGTVADSGEAVSHCVFSNNAGIGLIS